jgi:hypothetical protein
MGFVLSVHKALASIPSTNNDNNKLASRDADFRYIGNVERILSFIVYLAADSVVL